VIRICHAAPGTGHSSEAYAQQARAIRVAGWFGLWTLNLAMGFVVVWGDLGDQAVLVVDPPGGVRGFDGRASSVDDADVDALLGNDQRAAAGDASLHTQRLGRRIDAGAAAPLPGGDQAA
jgi:hypothetical protein